MMVFLAFPLVVLGIHGKSQADLLGKQVAIPQQGSSIDGLVAELG